MSHDCQFPEVDVEDVGLVIAPCGECGETPFEHLATLTAEVAHLNRALTQAEPTRPLYHWSPVARRKQIIRYGLRPSMRSVTSSAAFPVICFADSPAWAWALSAAMPWTPDGEWDLWLTSIDRLTDPVILPSNHRPSGMYEVRTTSRVYKRGLWWVASRVKA